MPRNARIVIPGLPYHVSQRGNDRQIVFQQGKNGDSPLFLAILTFP